MHGSLSHAEAAKPPEGMCTCVGFESSSEGMYSCVASESESKVTLALLVSFRLTCVRICVTSRGQGRILIVMFVVLSYR